MIRKSINKVWKLIILGAISVAMSSAVDQVRDYFPSPDETVISFFIDNPEGKTPLYDKVIRLSVATEDAFNYIHPRGIYIAEGRLTPTFPHGVIWINRGLDHLGENFANYARSILFIASFMFWTSTLSPKSSFKDKVAALLFFLLLPPVLINFHRKVLYDIPAIIVFILIWSFLIKIEQTVKNGRNNLKSFSWTFLLGISMPIIAMINVRAVFWVMALAIAYIPFLIKNLKKIRMMHYFGFIEGVVAGLTIFFLSDRYFYGDPLLNSYAAQSRSIAESSNLVLPYLFFDIPTFIRNVTTYYLLLFGPLFVFYLFYLRTNWDAIEKKVIVTTALIFLVVTFYFSNLGGWGSRSVELTGSFLRYMLPLLLIMSVSMALFYKEEMKRLIYFALLVLTCINVYNFGFSSFNISTFSKTEQQIKDTREDIFRSSTEKTLFVTLQQDKLLFPERLVTSSWLFPGKLKQDPIDGNRWIMDSEEFNLRAQKILETDLVDEILIDSAVFYGDTSEFLLYLRSKGVYSMELLMFNEDEYIRITLKE